MTTFSSKRGFTLLELMIAVAIVGILAAIAYPSYRESVMKSRRSDAKAALLQVQLAQEKWRANNTTYGTLAQIGVGATSSEGYYTIAVTGNTATAYNATAAPTGAQTGDKCGTFTINQAGQKGVTGAASGYTAASCW